MNDVKDYIAECLKQHYPNEKFDIVIVYDVSIPFMLLLTTIPSYEKIKLQETIRETLRFNNIVTVEIEYVFISLQEWTNIASLYTSI